MKSLVFFFSVIALHAQMVEGTIVDAITNLPLPDVKISVSRGSGQALSATRSDFTGHFRISVPESDSQLAIYLVKPGYFQSARSLARSASPASAPLQFKMTPQSVITGRVEDADGYPATGAFVEAVQYRELPGRTSRQAVAMGTPNDLGEYRITPILPGNYYIQVRPTWQVTAWDSRYADEFYGGSLTAKDARMVEVKPGENLTGIDFRLKRREGVTVTARIVGIPASIRPEQITVNLQNDDRFTRSAMALPDQTYSVRHVPPGSYNLTASARVPANPKGLSARRTIEVATADLTDVIIDFGSSTGVDISGQVLYDGAAPPCLYNVGLRGAGTISPSAKTKPDGAFTMQGVTSGHYTLVLNGERTGPQQCLALIASATIGGSDVLVNGFDVGSGPMAPLRILLTTKVGSLEGKVVGASGTPAGAMLVFENASSSRLASVNTQQGRFTVRLLPGTYHVFAATTQADSQNIAKREYRIQHANDLPLVRVVEGDNPPLTITLIK